MDEVLHLTASMTLGRPAERKAIAKAERALGEVSHEYVEFLLLHNGGEGPVGTEGYARFFPIEDLAYSELGHLADWLLFGTDGGGEAFLFDHEGQVMMAPWIGDRGDAVAQGRFREFVRRLAEGTTLDRRNGA